MRVLTAKPNTSICAPNKTLHFIGIRPNQALRSVQLFSPHVFRFGGGGGGGFGVVGGVGVDPAICSDTAVQLISRVEAPFVASSRLSILSCRVLLVACR